MTLRNLLISTDTWSGKYIWLEQPLTTVDCNLDSKGGVYTAEEWKITRSKGYNKIGENGNEISTDLKYINRILSKESRKLLAALSLIRNVDLSKYGSIIEIGCGEMIQAFVAKQVYPETRYLATDIDSYIIEKCSQLPILSNIEKKVFNVLEDDLEMLKGFDLIIAWGVEYAIDTANVNKLLQAAKKHAVPCLICTQQIIGPFRYWSRMVKTRAFNPRLLRERGVRLHGWVRSLKFWRHAAASANMRLEIVPSPSTIYGEETHYYWLFFKP